MNVRWTDRSRQHLRAIRDYIASDSLKYANRTVDCITRKGDGLYRVGAEGIEILAVIHAARQLPRDTLE